LQFQEDAKKLEELADKLANTEARYTDRQKTFWHSLWYHVGDTKDTLDAWVALIPNEYGLAVVKTGLAVVFKVCLCSLANVHGLRSFSWPKNLQKDDKGSKRRS
jgi:hypothetical protein